MRECDKKESLSFAHDSQRSSFGTECILAFVPVETKALYIYKENNIKNRQ